MQDWPSSHGSSLRKLHVGSAASCCSCLPVLPCTRLEDLHLGHCCLQLQPTGQLFANLTAATALTSLSLADMSFTAPPDLTAVVGALPNLQRLSLLLQEQHLRGVTHLELEGGLSAEFLQGLGSITRLQHLHLQDNRSSDTAQALPAVSQLQALTLLQLGQMICNLTPSILPGLSGLTALHTLALEGSVHWRCSMQAAVLEGVTQLQHLRLQHMTRFAVLPGAGSTGALLALLPSMQRLTDLELLNLDLWGAPVTAYAAITSSTALQRLNLSSTFCGGDDDAIWQEVLCRRDQPLLLQALKLHSTSPALAGSMLGRVVDCCTQLEALDVSFTLTAGANLSVLTRLHGLTQLAVSSGFDQEMLQAVPCMTQLRDLQVHCYTTVSAADLLQLTVLRQLTCLTLQDERGMISTNLRSTLLGSGFGFEGRHRIKSAADPDAASVSVFSMRNQASLLWFLDQTELPLL